jgi:hypothetical protein
MLSGKEVSAGVVRKETLGERGGRPAVAHSVLSRFEALVPPLQAIREWCGAANLIVRARVARTRRGAARRSAGDASDTLLVPAFRLACGLSLHTRREEAWGGMEGEGEELLRSTPGFRCCIPLGLGDSKAATVLHRDRHRHQAPTITGVWNTAVIFPSSSFRIRLERTARRQTVLLP